MSSPHSALNGPILIVDDERVVADTLTIILNQNGYSCFAAYDGDEAVVRARELKPRIAILDIVMRRMNGVTAAIQIVDEFPDTKIVLYSGQLAVADLLKEAEDRGYDFSPVYPSPFHPQDLLRILRNLGVVPLQPGPKSG